jgi:hypothetical protein
VTASTPDAYTVIRRVLGEGFCTGNEAIVGELFPPDQAGHQFGLTGTGAVAIQHVKDAIATVHSIAPDLA